MPRHIEIHNAAWIADVPGSSDKYLAVFNLAGATNEVAIAVKIVSLGFTGKCTVRDLWQRTIAGSATYTIAPCIRTHGAGLYRVSGK